MHEINSLNINFLSHTLEEIDITNIGQTSHIPYKAELAFDESKGIELYRFRINENNFKVIQPEKILLIAFSFRHSFNRRVTYYFFFRQGKRRKWLTKANSLSLYKNKDYLFRTENEAISNYNKCLENWQIILDRSFNSCKEKYLSNIRKLDKVKKI